MKIPEIITLEMYLKGRDKTYPTEYTKEIEENAKKLLKCLNEFLNELGITEVIVTSGWRPPSLNKTISNASKKSHHQTGKACDIKDDSEQSLCKLILSKPELLRTHGLWMEDPAATKGWTHLDIGLRSERPIRVFKP